MKYVLFWFAVFYLISPVSHAGDSHSGKVEKMWVRTSTTLVRVNIEGVQNNAPSCHTNTLYDYSFDASTEQGKLIYATLLAAQKANTEITVKGFGTCTNSIEDLDWITPK